MLKLKQTKIIALLLFGCISIFGCSENLVAIQETVDSETHKNLETQTSSASQILSKSETALAIPISNSDTLEPIPSSSPPKKQSNILVNENTIESKSPKPQSSPFPKLELSEIHPENRKIVFGTGIHSYLLEIGNNEARQITGQFRSVLENGATEPKWSPSKKRILLNQTTTRRVGNSPYTQYSKYFTLDSNGFNPIPLAPQIKIIDTAQWINKDVILFSTSSGIFSTEGKGSDLKRLSSDDPDRFIIYKGRFNIYRENKRHPLYALTKYNVDIYSLKPNEPVASLSLVHPVFSSISLSKIRLSEDNSKIIFNAVVFGFKPNKSAPDKQYFNQLSQLSDIKGDAKGSKNLQLEKAFIKKTNFVDFSKVKNKVVFTQGGDIFINSLNNEPSQKLTQISSLDNFKYLSSPKWSKDGKHIAFIMNKWNEPNVLYVMDAKGKGFTQITSNNLHVQSFDW